MTVDALGEPWLPFLQASFPPGVTSVLEPMFASAYVGAGPRVREFERALEAYLGASHLLCTSSCTAALTLAYLQVGVRAGDVVLATPMTCAATNVPLIHLGATIVWLDIDASTGNVTPATLEAGLRACPEARAAVIVDWAGTPCDYAGLGAVARTRGASIILDAAQSFGSTYRGSLLPSVGDFICYSFGPTKILSSVEGGAVITRDAGVAAAIRAARWYGVERDARSALEFWDYDIFEPGHRFITNDVFATVGTYMLQRFAGRLATHRALAALYRAELDATPGLALAAVPRDVEPNYWMFTVSAERRSDLLRKLHGAGIHAATPHNRNDRLSCFRRLPAQDLPGATRFADTYLCLPIGPWVRPEDCLRVCAAIRSGW